MVIEQGDGRLKGSKLLWLSNEEHINVKHTETFNSLKRADLNVAHAWAIKEWFRDFWEDTYAGCAKRHFDQWYSWAIRSRLTPIKAKASMKQSFTQLVDLF